jgi:hypothetical protein
MHTQHTMQISKEKSQMSTNLHYYHPPIPTLQYQTLIPIPLGSPVGCSALGCPDGLTDGSPVGCAFFFVSSQQFSPSQLRFNL